ncbi:hypothetical protein GGI25_000085 [Coemansia spiralis]|uniref:Transcription elongation factor Eaf N-terminal domain-containing protein n=2 Tax=Coemansia TaxID=4863 RepID=A0A9W8L0U3_9FUNG|nr:hypothetical protein EDC05_002730 [Coemansia umbellata]KAJ2623036.1 hypothetical protein GGI26_002645 [Coemansia sp. RSA 1358]KAJ2681130.1 hypothetical protein GGI25_000085 [Coemansia spiralis]
MSINFDQQTTYQLRLGVTMQSNDESESVTEDSGFHLISRQLPRTTTKLCRETLETGSSLRARLLGTAGKNGENSGDRRPAIFEAGARDQKTVCTYEGEYVYISQGNDSTSPENDEVDCVLIYDNENKAFVIERVASNTTIKSSSQNGVGSGPGGPASGLLALPSNQYDPSKMKRKAETGSGPRRESTMDEAAEDELAKELEGMLDDVSDSGDASGAASSERLGRNDSMRQNDKWENLEEQLNLELAENLDDELFEAPGSDEDEFEEVDDAQFVDEMQERQNSVDDDEDMLFEEIDPSADIGSNGGVEHLASRGSGGSAADDDFEFEEVGSPSVTQISANSAGMDEALFGGSYTSSPNTLHQPGQDRSQQQQQGLQDRTTSISTASGRVTSGNMRASTDQDTEMGDEFEDLDFDLTQSLQGS